MAKNPDVPALGVPSARGPPGPPALQAQGPPAEDLSADAERALDKLRALDVDLAQRYDDTRAERRKERR
jgi:hypothetical protein